MSNVTLLFPLTGAVIPLSSSPLQIPVAALAAETGRYVVVRVDPAQDVKFARADNATSSIGSAWSPVLKNFPDATATTMESTEAIEISISVSDASIGTISLISSTVLDIELDVQASGPCISSSMGSTRLAFRWLIAPLPPPSAIMLATKTTFRSATAVSAVLGNPVTSMSTTGMISILSLDECIFSDVDPLDSSVSPITSAAIGPPLGRYYRGAVVVALSLYGGIGVLALSIALLMTWRVGALRGNSDLWTSLAPHFASLRFPSSGMIVVGLFGQGLASCGVSLIRLGCSDYDVALGMLSLIVCTALVIFTHHVTTRGLQCRVEAQQASVSSAPACLRQLVAYGVWRRHWKDCSGSMKFKKRYMMLIDDLERPWWTAVELSSCLVQGSILGVRINSTTVCRTLLWVLAAHCGLMIAAAAYARPCGAVLSNVFLVLSKLGSFIISCLILLHAMTLDDVFASAADLATTLCTALCAIQVLLQVLIAITLDVLPALSPRSLRRRAFRIARHGVPNSNQRSEPPALTVESGPIAVVRLNEEDDSINSGEHGARTAAIVKECAGAIAHRDSTTFLMEALNVGIPRESRLHFLLLAAARRQRGSSGMPLD